jgi:hypothetical protein
MTGPFTSFSDLEGDCEGQVRDYIVAGKNGEPVRMEKHINPSTGESLNSCSRMRILVNVCRRALSHEVFLLHL